MSKKRNRHYSDYPTDDRREETENTELYDDDISRIAVGRLFNDDVRMDEGNAEGEYAADTEDDGYAEAEPPASAEDEAYQAYIASMATTREEGRMPKRVETGGRRRDASQSPGYKKIVVQRDEPRPPAAPAKRWSDYEKADDDYEAERAPTSGTKEAVLALLSGQNLRYVFAAVVALLLIIILMLVFKVNASGSSIAKLQKDSEDAKTVVEQNQRLLITIDDLELQLNTANNELSALQAENNSLRTDLSALQTNTAPDVNNPPDPGASAGTGTSTDTPPSGGGQRYTIVAGDNLWKIANKFYGDGNRSGEIKKANNITDESKIQIGTIIIIP